MDPHGRLSVGLRCDAGAQTGVGHLIRCIALAEELVDRGVDVVFLGDFKGLPWAERQLVDRGFRSVPVPADPTALTDSATALGLAAVVLDGYHLDPGSGAALRGRGVFVLALVDGTFGAEQRADAYLDQNLGASRPSGVPADAIALTGLDYVLLRDLVRSRRPADGPRPQIAETPHVLAVFGGTDPHDAALRLVPLILATDRPLSLTAVASRERVVENLLALPASAGQRLDVCPPVDDLPALVASADLVVSASGTSVWELLHLGAPTALVCVTDNQEIGYRQVVSAGLTVPLGRLWELDDDAPARHKATEALREVLGSPPARRELASRGLALVDGRGRERVADVLLRATATRRP